MDREIKLTLNSDTAPKAPVVGEKNNTEDPEFSHVHLTKDEMDQIDSFAETINLKDTQNILEYGVGAQTQIASFSEKTLNSVRTKDLGEVGDLLSSVVVELRNFEIDEEEKGIKSFFKKTANKASGLQAKYAKAETNVDTITKTLEGHQIQLMKDIATLDQMYELNSSYYKELSMYIMAGNKRLKKAREEELPELQQKATNSNSPIVAQEAKDFLDSINRFEKKIHDLDLTRVVSLQMAPQIRMIQAGDSVMVEKIQSTLVNTIPLWKSQMVLALGAAHTGQAAKAQQEVTDLTNELLRKNAETLHQSTVATARASERSIVDVETLRHTNDELIAALTEVRQIQEEGHRQRQEASQELLRLEQDLKKSLIEIANK